mmetsp:Transcript_16318/g.23014  ORF Transcript_16318/g.23014 Transcript_16318/m.23014 type:complete len:622 (+) Transcript_16318:172-2037(+)
MKYLRSSCSAVLLLVKSADAFLPSSGKWHGRSHGVTTQLFVAEDISVEDALQRTKLQLENLKTAEKNLLGGEEEKIYKEYMQMSGNMLKQELNARGLPSKGRKPDLARRLTDCDLEKFGLESLDQTDDQPTTWEEAQKGEMKSIDKFCGLTLSESAGKALGGAKFNTPSPIQRAAIPTLAQGESSLLYAETGSGKTLAYLLPITEQLWLEIDEDQSAGFAVIMTPTRELAAQVAGIATVLAPPGSVRLVSHPTNLLSDPTKDRGDLPTGGRMTPDGLQQPRIFVGSAKAVMVSLFGDDKKMPAPPTSKPEAKFFLQNTRWVVLDEVDRLLNVKKTRAKTKNKVHEKPAAIVTSAAMRLSLGESQIIAASATVGRPLKRELARVMGLPPQDCPRVIRGSATEENTSPQVQVEGQHIGRAVTIPNTVRNYVTPVEGSSPGKLLTSAFFVIKALSNRPRKILVVLTRNLDLSTKNAIGALKHFGCTPEPKSLLDALEADGTDQMIEVFREVSGAKGVGESYFSTLGSDVEDGAEDDGGDGYVLVTGEDTIRGLHLDGLDVVIVVGRPAGPDEYTHIAGRTGRAGRNGNVINVVSNENAAGLKSWEKMLDVDFLQLGMDEVATLH